MTADAQEDVPRDVRLLHLLLASQAIHQYEDQVPLQLMDFAHRYTRGVLKDAVVFSDYAASDANAELSVEDIRLAIGARTQYQFKPTAPKELLLQLAAERNKKALPQVVNMWGTRLPPEKYCLTAKEWRLEDEVDEDGNAVGEEPNDAARKMAST
ncbi:LAFE_0D06942g1_1 [Lachancea fermentati]|uniref:LAFE_0D06942g1_1 n=1 Tax=Lachancea fermentati TaxID=4955 RepID=A0A1G4MBP4_LACFM|nr:LAFE_0D06942g1_1 [Lachancea fermentati]